MCTSVEGLSNAVYDVFAYFWAAESQDFSFGVALTNHPSGSLPLYATNSADVTVAASGDFSETVMVASSDRLLYQVALGSVSGTRIDVYIDDEADAGISCWYDGIGYRLHQNEEEKALPMEFRLTNQYFEVELLEGRTVDLYGKSELHITAAELPVFKLCD